MLHTTDAIVLSLQPHSDKAHLLHAYTRTGGRINYMVYGLGKKNTSGKYSPLSLLQITTDDRSIRTAQLTFVPKTTNNNPYKRSIALFVSEVLFHVLRHPMEDEPMFDFLVETIKELDTLPVDADQGLDLANFHLRFLILFAAKLGFALPSSHEAPPEDSPDYPFPTTRKARQAALRTLCAYFEEHVETWHTPKSLDILMEVFD